ncbi:pentatricopeptide repeat-containing protein, partial [Tanacetum coccineum]
LMDMHGNVVFRIHYNGVFQYDPLRYEQCRVTEMQACTIDRIMFSQLLDMLVAKLQNGSDEEVTSKRREHDKRKKHAGNMSVEELVAWVEEEAKSPYLSSPPLKSRPFRNDIKGRVLFTDMYCAEDEGFEMTPPLNDDEVGKEDLLLYCSDLENDCVNDVAKILKGMSAGKNAGMNEGMNEGMDVATNDLDEQNLESDSDHSDKSFYYLSNGEDELIEHRKRMIHSKVNGAEVPDEVPFDEVPRTAGDEGTSAQGQHTTIDVDRKLKGNGMRITDPFVIVQESKEMYPIYDDLTHWKLKKPKLGEKFPNVDKFKECLTFYALANRFSLYFERSNKEKIVAKCGQRKQVIKDPSQGKQRSFKKYPSNNAQNTRCNWRCYCKLMKTEDSYQVVSLIDDHCCVRNFNYGRLISYKWLGRHFGDKIRMNPQITLDEIARLVKRKYKCIVSRTQCRNDKNFTLNEGEVTIQDHYGYLRSYAKALADSNQGGTIKVGVTVNPDEKTYFDRFYVCFKALKDGWKMGCRRIIALDGCFLKKANYGEILTAVDRDGNNHIFPVAWDVVSVENKDNWSWFLELIAEDLEVPNRAGLTLMYDQHKGLIEAVKDVMPLAKHRQCARHIYDGFRKQFSRV